MKEFTRTIFLFFFFSSLALAQCETRNHVFLIHGIGGGKGTFGSLERILNSQNPCVQARSFEYDTGSKFTPHEFAKDFHKYVMSLRNVIQSQDKISLIMHSQGGLVGTLWLKNMLQDKSDMIKHVDAFITLSTPFWGADIANVGKKFFFTLPEGVENPISPFGRNELNEMSYGSLTIHELSQNLDKIFAGIPNMRPLIIAGMRKIYGPKTDEDDLIVPTYSMRPDRIYLNDSLHLLDKPSRVPASAFKPSDEVPFVIVSADHIKLTQAGVADIPSSCVRNLECGHPSLKYILNQLKGAEIKTNREYPLSKFRFTMFVNNPHEFDYEHKDLTIEISGLGQETKVPFFERFTTKRGNSKRKEGLAFSFDGQIKSRGKASIQVALKFKNKLLKAYTAPVEAGKSTFVDVTLSAPN